MTATVTSLPVWPADVPVHAAAELFPLMSGADFDELVKDVRANGLVTPIVRTPDGLILDGRNRYRACLAAGVRPVYEVHGGEPWRFVISTNLHRRHLTDSQRAMVAAKIAERAHGGWAHVNRPKLSDDDLGNLPPTRAEAAQMLSVSPSQVDRARVVEKRGTESLKTAVETGAVPVSTAARVANELTADEQNDFVEKVNSGADPRRAASRADRARDIPPEPVAEPVVADEPSRQRRRPIADAANDIGWDMRKQAEKLSRLLDDDRLPKNEEQVALALRGHLLFVAETVATALNKLGN